MEAGKQSLGYLFERKIGQGGMAEVWQVKSLTTAEELAVKLLLPEFCSTARIRVRFEREGHVQLVHPNIASVFRLEVFEGRPGLVMPLYTGGSLEARIRSTPEERESGVGKPLPLSDVLTISEEILGALDYANQQEIIHRDVKPDNILFDNLDRAHLSDFGIALDMKRLAVTEAGGEFGTALYSSPELIQRPRRVDHRTDVYSCGCCIYDMCAGRPPFIAAPGEEGAGTFALKLAHVNDLPPDVRQFNPDVPPELAELLAVALAKAPDDRLPGCGEFARRLRLIRNDLFGAAGDETLRAGQRISGYLFGKKIGQGGMAEVWRVQHIETGEQLAAKILLPEYGANSNVRVRFEREGHTQLTHPNIVPVRRLETFRGRPAMVMPLYSGGSLEDRIRRTPEEKRSGTGKPLPLADALSISRQILAALDFANQQQVIHRDVKPDNILFDAAGTPHLADFGIALDMKRATVTQAGGDLGTPLYISPEQIRDPRKVDHRADVYSFGCCIYDMLTGRPPFLSEEEDDEAWSFNLRLKHVKEAPTPPTQRNRSVPETIERAVLKALSKEKESRFAGSAEFAQALIAAQSHVREGPLRRGGAWVLDASSRLPWVATVAISAALVLALLFGAGWVIGLFQRPVADSEVKQLPSAPGGAKKQEKASNSGPPVTSPPLPQPRPEGEAPSKAAPQPKAPTPKYPGKGRRSDEKKPAPEEELPPRPAPPRVPVGGSVIGDSGSKSGGSTGAVNVHVVLRVVDPSGEPIPGAALWDGTESTPIPRRGFRLGLTENARYTWRFSAPGYPTVSRTIVPKASDSEITITLVK